MLRNLLKVTLRNFYRQRSFAIMNFLGLSLGYGSCLLILLYSVNELSYDEFHEKKDRIYRINQTFIWGDEDALFGSTGPAVMHAISREVPDFEVLTRVHTPNPTLISRVDNRNKVFEEDKILAVDSSFLDVFTFPLLRGDKETALNQPYSIILTESLALKYFGTIEIIGNQLLLGEKSNKKTYQITGVSGDVVQTSHIQYDFLISMSSIPRVQKSHDSWMWTTFVTFGLLQEGTDVYQAAEKVQQVPAKYLNTFLMKYRGMTYKEFLDADEEWNLYMQPMTDIHLSGDQVFSRLNKTGNMQTLYIFWFVGGLILCISIINFVNLSTARATTRAKEVGIRKVIGSDRQLLIFQFLTESTTYVLGAALIAFFLTELSLPFFNTIIDSQLSLGLLLTPKSIVMIGVVILVTGILSGVYPAFLLSSFKPAQVLKRNITQGLKGSLVRNTLMTFQFSISIALIACTLIVHEQISFWKNADLGFDRENKIIIEDVQRLGNGMKAFKNELLQNPLIENISHASDTPPYLYDFDNFSIEGQVDKTISVNYITTDENFILVYGLNLLHGRNLSGAFQDSTNIVVNVEMTRALGFINAEDALNNKISNSGTEYTIIGILEDFNSNLSIQTYPTALFDPSSPIFRDPSEEFTISLNRNTEGKEIKQLLADIQTKWQQVDASAPFDYTFLDQEYMNVFSGTLKFSKMLSGFSILALIIAGIGLVGLVAFVIEKRTKEIGIRKVLGANAKHVFVLLTGNFGKLMLIGFSLATPVSWYLMSQWLNDFPLRISLSFGTFLFAGIAMLVTALITLSFQVYRATSLNPVEYLKEE